MALLIYKNDSSNLYNAAKRYFEFVCRQKNEKVIIKSAEEIYELTNLPYPELHKFKKEDHYFMIEVENLDNEEAGSGNMDIDYTWVAILNNMIRNVYKLDYGKNMFYFGLKVKPLKKPGNYYEAFRLRINSWSKKNVLHKFRLKQIDKIMRIEDPNFVFAHGGSNG